MRSKSLFLFITLLFFFISYPSDRTLATQKKPDIISTYESEGDRIKVLGNGWFEVTGKAIIQNITPEQAEEQAIFNACRDAVRHHCGIEAIQRTLDLQAVSKNKVVLDHFSSLSKQATRGIILEKNVICKEIKTDGTNLIQTVVLRVKVAKQKGEKDPYFEVWADLNRRSFKEGDELELKVESSKDCYITVLNICSNDTVYVLFPNQYRNNNFLKAKELFRLPHEEDKMKGLSFRPKLLQGKEEDVEMIKVLATKENISLIASHTLSAYGIYELDLKKLLNWLIKIPLDQIEEVDLQYFITKK